MRIALLLALFACGGPNQQRLADSPTARTRATPTEAPAASVDDRDREQVQKSNDGWTDASNARAESRKKTPPPAPLTDPVPPPAPAKP